MILEEQKKDQKILQEIRAEPIAEKKPYQEIVEKSSWRKKKVRKIGLKIEINKNENDKQESSDNYSELPGENQEIIVVKSAYGVEHKLEEKKKKKNKKIQEKLLKMGEKIPVATEKSIKLSYNSQHFKYLIYDGYRPQNLAQAREYVNFLVRENLNLNEEFSPEQTPKHILEYLEQELKTDLPNNVKENDVLDFDQNFECGNLDSVYLQDIYEYNLLMKVDTNTRGNTYWFMFKVCDFQVGIKYKFNILNFTRNFEKFYVNGMNILVKTEKMENQTVYNIQDSQTNNKNDDKKEDRDHQIGEWRYNNCQNIEFIPVSNIIRSATKKAQTGEIIGQRFYSKLSFSYRFQDIDRDNTVVFAYSIPYGYSDLLKDLRTVRDNLMKTEGAIFKPINKEDYLESGYNQQNNQSPTAQQNVYLSEEEFMKNFEGSQSQGQGATAEESILTRQQIQGHKDNMKQLVVNKNSFKVSGDDQKVQKLNQYEIQHLSIKREGINLMSIHNNHFEQMIQQNQINLGEQELKNQLMYEQNIQQPQFEDHGHENELGKMREHNFEISNKYLHYRQEVLGQSVCGLNLYQLTITKRSEVSMKHKKKQAMYIQARLHAAETTGSLIMSYIMQEISQNPEKYDKILNNYVIKLSPMLNPDGVVIGNSRSSLAGLDLNRRWSDPNPIMHPEIYFMKNHMILTEKQCKGISVFCDLHGHNKHMNCFIYGCNKAPNEGLLSWTKTRLLPKIIASIEPIFDFNDCLFSQEKMKYNTARVVIWNEFKVMNSFTLETSMYGYYIKDSQFIPGTLNKLDASKLRQVCKQLTLEDFKSIGTSLLKSFVQYVDMEIELEKEFKATGGWLKKQKLDELAGETARKKIEINIVLTQQQLREKKKVPILRKSQISIHNPTIQQQVSLFY